MPISEATLENVANSGLYHCVDKLRPSQAIDAFLQTIARTAWVPREHHDYARGLALQRRVRNIALNLGSARSAPKMILAITEQLVSVFGDRMFLGCEVRFEHADGESKVTALAHMPITVTPGASLSASFETSLGMRPYHPPRRQPSKIVSLTVRAPVSSTARSRLTTDHFPSYRELSWAKDYDFDQERWVEVTLAQVLGASEVE